MKTLMRISLTVLTFAFYIVEEGKCQENTADCAGALMLCEKKDIFVKNLYGVGKEPYEVGFSRCSKNLVEKNTIWIKWVVDSPGDIGFTVIPLQTNDDIDFIVYKINGDIWNCSEKHEIRCMAAGVNVGAIDTTALLCLGRTGLRVDDADLLAKDGCGAFQDNFLSSFYAYKGEAYILYINNYSSDNGFRLVWSGDATFSGITQLPASEQINRSNLIYYDSGEMNHNIKWSDAILEKAIIAHTNFDRPAVNTFAGCSNKLEMYQDEIVIDLNMGSLFPNPVATTLYIPLRISVHTLMKVSVYNTLGNLSSYSELITDIGEQVLQLPVNHLSSGLYFIKFEMGGFQVVRKIIVHN